MRVLHCFERFCLLSIENLLFSLKSSKSGVVAIFDSYQPVHSPLLLFSCLYTGPICLFFLTLGLLSISQLLVKGNEDLVDIALLKPIVYFALDLSRLKL